MGVVIEFEIAGHDDGVLFVLEAAGPTQHGADAGDDLFEAEGLRDVVIAADGQAGDLVRGVITGGEEHDRSVHADLAEATRDGEAVHVRQHHVEDEEIGVGLLGQTKSFGAVGSRDDVESCEAQAGREEFADIGLIVDNEECGFDVGIVCCSHASSLKLNSESGLTVP